MKKTILILTAAAATLYFSACKNSDDNQDVIETPVYTQEQLDSINAAKEDSINAANAMMNDSLLNKMAQDSIAAAEAAKTAAATGKVPVSKPKTKPNTNQSNTNTPVVKPKQEVRTQEQINADKKAAKFGDKNAQDRLNQDADDKKSSKFGNKDAKDKVQQTSDDKKSSKFNK
ncbi:MAG TPA: hypothetical protein VLZ83_14925 [Edaphocola sp.]|nr:hypothetical protein [Edaphocola sp.]